MIPHESLWLQAPRTSLEGTFGPEGTGERCRAWVLLSPARHSR